MTIETLVHGEKQFAVSLKYAERTEPIVEKFYTQIERDAFVKGITLAANFFEAPTVVLV